jgi:hypothetical protein
MASYWIQDQQGLVLGPVGLEVLKDLSNAKRLGDFTKVSQDGTHWQALSSIPEVAHVLSPGAPERAAQEAVQAQRVRAELARYISMPTHALFGVSAGSNLSVCRQGFLALAKPFHPARLAQDVHPELLRAHMEMFQFLSGRMVELERSLNTPPPPPPAARVATPLPPGTAPPGGFELLKRPSDGRLSLKVDLTFANASMLTEHKLVNFRMGGMFLPCERFAPLGTWLDVLLRFSTPSRRDVNARGSVVWENLLNAAYPKGYGVRLEGIKQDDHAFVRGFIDSYQASRKRA